MRARPGAKLGCVFSSVNSAPSQPRADPRVVTGDARFARCGPETTRAEMGDNTRDGRLILIRDYRGIFLETKFITACCTLSKPTVAWVSMIVFVRDGDPLFLHFIPKLGGESFCLIIAPGVGMGLERSQHHVDTVDRLVGPDFGNGLHANILCLAHDVFKIFLLVPIVEEFLIVQGALEARLVNLGAENVVLTLADEPTVDLIKIGR
ncbi:hypothetical protein N7471_002187 [Penicillium samsonianum]|uniref:uncharacterized protein n=1 Tax=Penicillium samsonianum TaxID=1882272 RepID=UPI002547CE2C|nr:uncharacterized protein N7471_002187 [Penicillium samsonianum]KAJ6142734.1 hypothetical protein N7471_002187 [Penicillium samsonianum]